MIKYLTVEDVDTYGDSIINSEEYDYNLDDCLLVRVTDILPINKEIIPPKDTPDAYLKDTSLILEESIKKILREKYPNKDFDENEYNKYIDECSKYDIKYKNVRPTTHFCINGLVESHEQGNFENRPFVIIEPLKYHVDESLEGLTTADTYYKGEFNLSDESYLLIDNNYFEENKNDLDFLNEIEKYNVVVYNGDQRIAVQTVINSLGYDMFAINKHGYINGLKDEGNASNMHKYLDDFTKTNNISTEKHCYSKVYQEEEYPDTSKEMTNRSIEHLRYILDNCSLNFEDKKDILLQFEETNNINPNDIYLETFIQKLGLDELLKLTNEYNQAVYQDDLKNKITK